MKFINSMTFQVSKTCTNPAIDVLYVYLAIEMSLHEVLYKLMELTEASNLAKRHADNITAETMQTYMYSINNIQATISAYS